MTTVDESRGISENGRPNIFGDFRRAILWGGYGGVPGSIGGLGSAYAPYALQNARNWPKIYAREARGRPIGSGGLGEMTIAHGRLIPPYWCSAHPLVIIGASGALLERRLAVPWKVANAPFEDFT